MERSSGAVLIIVGIVFFYLAIAGLAVPFQQALNSPEYSTTFIDLTGWNQIDSGASKINPASQLELSSIASWSSGLPYIGRISYPSGASTVSQYTIETRVQFSAAASAGDKFRLDFYDQNSHLFYVMFTQTTMQLETKDISVTTQLGKWYTIRVTYDVNSRVMNVYRDEGTGYSLLGQTAVSDANAGNTNLICLRVHSSTLGGAVAHFDWLEYARNLQSPSANPPATYSLSVRTYVQSGSTYVDTSGALISVYGQDSKPSPAGWDLSPNTYEVTAPSTFSRLPFKIWSTGETATKISVSLTGNKELIAYYGTTTQPPVNPPVDGNNTMPDFLSAINAFLAKQEVKALLMISGVLFGAVGLIVLIAPSKKYIQLPSGVPIS